MHDFGTPVGSYLSNKSKIKSKRSDPDNDQQGHINLGGLTLKQQLIMLISENKFLQPMPRSPKIKTCMNLNLGHKLLDFILEHPSPSRPTGGMRLPKVRRPQNSCGLAPTSPPWPCPEPGEN